MKANFTIFLLFFAILFFTNCQKETISLEKNNGAGLSGSITRFTVSGNYMYALDQNQVLTYSLKNPDAPTLLHRLPTDYGLQTITIYDNTVYLGSATALYILDISTPEAPRIQAKSERDVMFGRCDPVVVKGNYAYSTVKTIANICGNISSQSALIVYDISNKNIPIQKDAYLMTAPNGLAYKDNFLFVCDEGSDVLIVFDISNPISLQQVSLISINDPIDIIAKDDKMIVSKKNGFDIYDTSKLPNLQKIASY